MFQRIDVVVYYVVETRRMMNRMPFVQRNGMTVLVWIHMQTFRLGVMRVITRKFSCCQNRNRYLFGIQMGDGSLCDRPFCFKGADSMFLRHRFLRFRFFQLSCPYHGKNEQKHQMDVFP